MASRQTTMLPFFRLEPNGSESCFYVEVQEQLGPEQMRKMRHSLAPFFHYLPGHKVTAASGLSGNIGEVGPRSTFQTPSSTSAVEILHAAGHHDVRRVEHFRRHVVPVGVSRDDFLAGRHDQVTEYICESSPETFVIDVKIPPIEVIPLLKEGADALRRFSQAQNLGFNESQIQHIKRIFLAIGKNPTDVSLFQLAQMWSDHCRHLLFNATLVIDGQQLPYTLFDLLRAPYQALKGGPDDNMLIAFYDNASAIRGFTVPLLVPANPGCPCPYVMQDVTLHFIISGETHNYPNHVAPYPGSQTEIGGEIRDQLGTGRGSDLLNAGCGRVLGSLRFPGCYRIPGEFISGRDYTYPQDKAMPLEILLKGLNGWHDYANCFGKPCTCGFFYSGAVWRPRRGPTGQIYYERVESLKPVCFGVSVGTIRHELLQKQVPVEGTRVIQIGGGAFPVGFCGGSGSSSMSGSNVAQFDENAIQRGNPEMERRFYQVLLACLARGVDSPIVTLHDQGAGGIANVLTELIEKVGGRLYIGAVNRGDPTMSDLKVWVCEYQERQGLVVAEKDVEKFIAICERENCPYEILGEVTGDRRLVVYSEKDAAEVAAKGAEPIIELDLPEVLANMPPIEVRDDMPEDVRLPLALPAGLTVTEAIQLVVRRSHVGSKDAVIRTVDASIGGQVVTNQRCGPFGTPINDFTLLAASSDGIAGQASSLGIAPFITVLDSPAGGRMALAEMITNLMGVLITRFEDIQCICNWMWPANIKPADGEVARLVATARGIKEALKALIMAIIGGKDSSSLATKVKGLLVKSIETVVFTSVAPVPNVGRYITPDLKYPGQSVLIHLDIANGKRRLGGSALGQCFGQLGDSSPDLDDPALLRRVFNEVQDLLAEGLITAGHDISDGGILTTVAEMCFGAGCGVGLELFGESGALAELFAEELGYVIECLLEDVPLVVDSLAQKNIPCRVIGSTIVEPQIQVTYNGDLVLNCLTDWLRREWERTSYEIAKLRIDPTVARRERRNTAHRPKPVYRLTFAPELTPPEVLGAKDKHRVAVIREQGSNGHEEMIAAFVRAGFEAWDVHMSDLQSGRLKDLSMFRGVIFPGGFSYGDVLGAAVGWAMKILRNQRLKQIFDDFFARKDTFSLGICNGAQLGLRCGWAPLPDLPAKQQPLFTTNNSRSFQHRWVRVKINPSPAIMLSGMAGSILGTFVANAEGYFNCDNAPEVLDRVIREGLAPVVYVDALGRKTTAPPYSPSGSFVAGVCDPTGRHLYMMPHMFDRGSLLRQWEYVPPEWSNLPASPWLEMGHNARKWCDAVS